MTDASPMADGGRRGDRVADPDRLAALARTGLMSSGQGDAFDRVVRLARRLVGADVALFSIVDAERQHFKAQVGLPANDQFAAGTPLSHSFCRHVVSSEEPLIVPDARQDPRVACNPAIDDLDVVAYLGVPVRAPEGEVLGSLCAIEGAPRRWTDDQLAALRDLAAMLEAEIALHQAAADRQLLAQELNHRVKNLFAVVSGMISLSVREETTAMGLAGRLRNRVHALAVAHDLIAPMVEAEGAAGPEISLKTLMTTVLAPHLDDGGVRVVVEGPDSVIGPRAATSLALAAHELATNAVKHGALSTAEGRLTVDWTSDDAGLSLRWLEDGAPSLPCDTAKAGFGSRLLDLIIGGQLRGRIDWSVDAGTLRYTISIPADRLAR